MPLKPVFFPHPPPDDNSLIEVPGKYPFTRGIYPSMYQNRLWTMRQYAGFGSVEDTNKRFKYLIESGSTGLSVAFDLPTQMGYDSDHPMAEGEVGRVGVPVSSLQDMEILFKDIPLEEISSSMTINSTAPILLAFYIVHAKNRGDNIKKLSGTIQNDLLKEYIARGTYIYPPDASMRIITDIFKYCQHNLPRWNTISISGYHIREAGSDAIQEVAFTLANGKAYVQAAIKAGLDVDDFASRLSFFFNAYNNLFEEVAKFRAARRLWAKIMRDQFHAKNEKSMLLRFHTQTGGSTLTAHQPQNNIVRVTIQALAAVLGGTQSLHTNSFDEAFALPTEDSVKTALRTQQIIAHESGVTDTSDPLGGSFYIESLTDKIEKKAVKYIKVIDDLGGSVEAIKKGFFQDEISKQAYTYQKEIENGDRALIGVNKFTDGEQKTPEMLKIDQKMIDHQIKRIQRYKQNRDKEIVSSARQKLELAARAADNLMPFIINCVEANVTLGEIADSLRAVFGSYQENN